MIIKIKTISNGYLLIDSEGETTAFTEGSQEEAFASMVAVLWQDWIGEPYNKYGENNIRITFDKKGHKL